MSGRNLPEYWQLLNDEDPASEMMRHRRPGKSGKDKNNKKPVLTNEFFNELVQEERYESNQSFTYQASRHETGWLMESLGSFHQHRWIDDVLKIIKGGKEASVYLCQANPGMADGLLAAKVYRPRMLRNLRKDHIYREGRPDLDADGNVVIDHGMLNAMRKRTRIGLEQLHTSWIEHEYTTLQRLYAAGADVPQPYASGHNAILMEYIGDKNTPALILNSIQLTNLEAKSLFETVLSNIEILLKHQTVHADLSAYNILYWEGKITLIDFPQAIHPEQNRSAYKIFERDITRVCEYFIRQGIQSRPHRLAADLWTSHRYRLAPEIHPVLLDDQDERTISAWKKEHGI